MHVGHAVNELLRIVRGSRKLAHRLEARALRQARHMSNQPSDRHTPPPPPPPPLTMFLCLLTGCTEVLNEKDDVEEEVVDESLVDDGWDEDLTSPSTPVTKKSPLAQSVMLAQSSLGL
jgi:hypothetical protein